MESTTADELWDAITRDIAAKRDDAAQGAVDFVQQRLSVEVQRLPIPEIERRLASARGRERTRLQNSLTLSHRDDPIHGDGYKLLRSVRGEPARMETGRLRESMVYQTIEDGASVETVIFSDLDYAFFLETDRFGRLVLTDLDEQLQPDFLDADVRGIEGD